MSQHRERVRTLSYIDLARAKSEALDNIYNLCKQNIKSCNAKPRKQRRRPVKNNNRSNSQKSNFARATRLFCAFLYRCFARLRIQCETSTSYTFFGGNVVHVLVHFFFTAAHFHIGGRYLFPFCHHRYKIFMFFFQPKNVSFVCLFVFYLSL